MSGKRRWYLVLLVPFFGTLFPAFYNHAGPPLLGIPFFYWYQCLWVLLTPAIMGIVVLGTREGDDV